jgi:hypothetical protein
MSIIFDLKNQQPSWAKEINTALAKYWPEYIDKNGQVGSQKWWSRYEDEKISKETVLGAVKFIGEKIDEFDEEYDSIEIQCSDKILEFDRVGYWESPLLEIGKIVEIESFIINVVERYGPHIFQFERRVEVK